MASWQVNEARNQLSEVLSQAEIEGPQIITHHGKARAVVLSFESYSELETKKPDLISFLLNGPKPCIDDFEVERDRLGNREVDLDP